MLPHSEIQKRILAKPQWVRPEQDYPGLYNKHNDELHKIYKTKRKQFLDACEQYQKLNHEAQFICKRRLHEDYMASIRMDFLLDEFEHRDEENIKENDCGNRRIELPIHHQIEEEADCNFQPWFRRFVSLNRFIEAARRVVLKNRLERNLSKLRGLNRDEVRKFEGWKAADFNRTHSDVFERFLFDN